MVKHFHKLPQSHGGGGGLDWGVTGLYVRLRVWKILDIWSMTGPVSGSFIHCVLFRGFSSMSSKAAHKQKGKPLTTRRREVMMSAGKTVRKGKLKMAQLIDKNKSSTVSFSESTKKNCCQEDKTIVFASCCKNNTGTIQRPEKLVASMKESAGGKTQNKIFIASVSLEKSPTLSVSSMKLHLLHLHTRPRKVTIL